MAFNGFVYLLVGTNAWTTASTAILEAYDPGTNSWSIEGFDTHGAFVSRRGGGCADLGLTKGLTKQSTLSATSGAVRCSFCGSSGSHPGSLQGRPGCVLRCSAHLTYLETKTNLA